MARPDRALAVDAGLTGVLGVVFLASTAGASDARPLDGLGWALLAANVLPLLALRRAPLLVVACLSVAYPAWAALEYPTHLLQSLPTLAAMVAVGASPRPLWWRALALLCPLEMLAGAATGIWDVDLLEIGCVAIVFVSGWVLGVVLAARRSYTRALEEKTAALEAARQELAHRAVLEERTRIARDLHDILAHAMSVITVQAGVGGHLLERDPEQARGALRVIEETRRGALGERCSLMSSPPGWTRRLGGPPGTWSAGSGTTAPRWCWSPTSWRRPRSSATGWRLSTGAGWWPPGRRRSWSGGPTPPSGSASPGRTRTPPGCPSSPGSRGSPAVATPSRSSATAPWPSRWPRPWPWRMRSTCSSGAGGPASGTPPAWAVQVAATAVALWRLRDA